MIPCVQPVILCGGSGTRLWPLSRSGFPKQFLCLAGNESLFQQATRRLSSFDTVDANVLAPFVVTNEEYRFIALEQLRESGLDVGAILLEPCRRDTAAALTLAALAALDQGGDPILVVTPADQLVGDQPEFTAAMRSAIRAAATGSIVVLGIPAGSPQTGYGYIKTCADADLLGEALSVERFIEKPDAATAKRFLDEGGYYWNAGIFVLRASVWTATLECFRGDIAAASYAAWERHSVDLTASAKFVRPSEPEFAVIPAESIDYAVIERCAAMSLVRMVPLRATWSDVGAWDAVWEALSKDSEGNAHVGDVIAIDSRNNLVHASNRLVSLVGVSGLAVVETADAVLVTDLSRSQDVKSIVRQLTSDERKEIDFHRKVNRPWGWYDCIDEDGRFKVKRIQVRPKASLSLQMHRHRAEHWVVVRGTAEITCGDKTILLVENQSTYIPLGETHRLSNPGDVPLEIIEVQSGDYVGEDDIVRFDDRYGRIG